MRHAISYKKLRDDQLFAYFDGIRVPRDTDGVTVNKNFVTFSKGIVQELDYPSQVLIAFNKETKVMRIQVYQAKTRGSFKFSE